jgi:hypothetical protein
VDARCPACAAARARLHAAAPVVPDWVAALAVLLVTLAVLVAAHTH